MESIFFHPNFNYEPHGLKFRQSTSDRFRVHFSPIKRAIKDWKTECLYVSEKIKRFNKKKPILLFLSGGIDSAVIALCLKEVGANFQAIIVEFNNKLNAHDVSNALSLCETINIDPKIIRISPVHEWQKRGDLFSKKFQCLSPQIILFLIVCDSLDGLFIFGGGDPYFEYCPKKNTWLWEEEEKFYIISKYFLQRKALCCTHFFTATSEIIMSQLEDSLTLSLFKNSGNYFDFINYKNNLYKKHFGLFLREKYTGFENLKKEDKVYRKLFSSNPLTKNQILCTPIQNMIKQFKKGSGVTLQ